MLFHGSVNIILGIMNLGSIPWSSDCNPWATDCVRLSYGSVTERLFHGSVPTLIDSGRRFHVQ